MCYILFKLAKFVGGNWWFYLFEVLMCFGLSKTGKGNKQDPLLPGFRLCWVCLETGRGNKQDPLLPVLRLVGFFLKLVWVINKT